MTAGAEPAPQGSWGPRRILLGIVLPTLIGCVVLSVGLTAYGVEWQTRTSAFTVGELPPDGGAVVQARLESVDLARSVATFRLDATFQGEWGGQRGPRQDMVLVTNGRDRQEIPIKPATPFASWEVSYDIDGSVTDYPFDVHELPLLVDMATDPAAGTEAVPVPVRLELRSWVPGLRFMVEPVEGFPAGTQAVLLEMSRSGSTQYFVILVTVMMWALSLSALFMAWALLFRGRRIEATIFSFMAAMLFAFPALRSVMPGAPPIGAPIDYLGFFWAETILAVALFLALQAWFRRPYT